VSHLKERKERNCLTSPLYGRYCHVCGQENLVPRETVWHLVEHFFSDITHFDGKFFSTVKYLLKRPGFLSTEYMIGRRASYLNPIRMYVFTSALFFIILFSIQPPGGLVKVTETPGAADNEKLVHREGNGIALKTNLMGMHPENFNSVSTGQEYHRDSRGFSEHLAENFEHSYPKILFISLPGEG
jgi:hypothetical protein